MVPELTVSDFKKSLSFYTDLLGFKVRYRREEPDFVYLEQDTAHIMLEEKHNESWETAELDPPLGRGVNFQIELADIDKIYKKLAKAGYPYFEDMDEEWYETDTSISGQKEFLVQDPDGYLLRFVQHLGEKEKT